MKRKPSEIDVAKTAKDVNANSILDYSKSVTAKHKALVLTKEADRTDKAHLHNLVVNSTAYAEKAMEMLADPKCTEKDKGKLFDALWNFSEVNSKVAKKQDIDSSMKDAGLDGAARKRFTDCMEQVNLINSKVLGNEKIINKANKFIAKKKTIERIVQLLKSPIPNKTVKQAILNLEVSKNVRVMDTMIDNGTTVKHNGKDLKLQDWMYETKLHGDKHEDRVKGIKEGLKIEGKGGIYEADESRITQKVVTVYSGLIDSVVKDKVKVSIDDIALNKLTADSLEKLLKTGNITTEQVSDKMTEIPVEALQAKTKSGKTVGEVLMSSKKSAQFKAVIVSAAIERSEARISETKDKDRQTAIQKGMEALMRDALIQDVLTAKNIEDALEAGVISYNALLEWGKEGIITEKVLDAALPKEANKPLAVHLVDQNVLVGKKQERIADWLDDRFEGPEKGFKYRDYDVGFLDGKLDPISEGVGKIIAKNKNSSLKLQGQNDLLDQLKLLSAIAQNRLGEELDLENAIEENSEDYVAEVQNSIKDLDNKMNEIVKLLPKSIQNVSQILKVLEEGINGTARKIEELQKEGINGTAHKIEELLEDGINDTEHKIEELEMLLEQENLVLERFSKTKEYKEMRDTVAAGVKRDLKELGREGTVLNALDASSLANKPIFEVALSNVTKSQFAQLTTKMNPDTLEFIVENNIAIGPDKQHPLLILNTVDNHTFKDVNSIKFISETLQTAHVNSKGQPVEKGSEGSQPLLAYMHTHKHKFKDAGVEQLTALMSSVETQSVLKAKKGATESELQAQQAKYKEACETTLTAFKEAFKARPSYSFGSKNKFELAEGEVEVQEKLTVATKWKNAAKAFGKYVDALVSRPDAPEVVEGKVAKLSIYKASSVAKAAKKEFDSLKTVGAPYASQNPLEAAMNSENCKPEEIGKMTDIPAKDILDLMNEDNIGLIQDILTERVKHEPIKTMNAIFDHGLKNKDNEALSTDNKKIFKACEDVIFPQATRTAGHKAAVAQYKSFITTIVGKHARQTKMVRESKDGKEAVTQRLHATEMEKSDLVKGEKSAALGLYACGYDFVMENASTAQRAGLVTSKGSLSQQFVDLLRDIGLILSRPINKLRAGRSSSSVTRFHEMVEQELGTVVMEMQEVPTTPQTEQANLADTTLLGAGAVVVVGDGKLEDWPTSDDLEEDLEDLVDIDLEESEAKQTMYQKAKEGASYVKKGISSVASSIEKGAHGIANWLGDVLNAISNAVPSSIAKSAEDEVTNYTEVDMGPEAIVTVSDNSQPSTHAEKEAAKREKAEQSKEGGDVGHSK